MRRQQLMVVASVFALLTSAGCAGAGDFIKITTGVGGEGETEWSAQRAESYDGPECNTVLHEVSVHKGQISSSNGDMAQEETDDPAKQLLLAVCQRQIVRLSHRDLTNQRSKFDELDFEDAYYGYDDRRFDHLQAALITVHAHLGVPSKHAQISQTIRPAKPPLVGGVATLAKQIDRAELEGQIRELSAPDKAKQLFLKEFDAALADFDARKAELDEARKVLFYEIPEQVYQKRQAYFEKHAALYTRFDELVAQVDGARSSADAAALDKLVADFEKVRDDYVNACEADDCVHTPLYTQIAEQLALIHVARGDLAGTYAEQRPFTRNGDVDVTFAQQVKQARLISGKRMEDRFFKAQKARKKGVDADTIEQMVGSPRINFYARDMLTRVENKMPDYAGAMDQGRPRSFSSTVSRVRKKADAVELKFEDRKYTYTESYGCKESNKVDRVTRDGRIIYRKTGCKYRKKTNTRKGHPPVLVPATDAAGIKRGDIVSGVYVKDGDTRRGYVLEVSRGEGEDNKVVQIRGHAVK